MKKILPICAALLTAGSLSVAVAGEPDPMTTVWQLVKLNGEDVPAGATLQLTEGGVTGKGVCNTFHGERTGNFPTFEVHRVVSTRRACIDPPFNENEYFKALDAMETASLEGDVLTLQNHYGDALVFKAAE